MNIENILKNDNVELLKTYCRRNPDLSINLNLTFFDFLDINVDNVSIIHAACAYGSLKCFNYLQSIDFPLDNTSGSYLYPFHYAIIGNNPEIINALEQYPNSYDLGDEMNSKSFLIACYAGNIYLVKKLWCQCQGKLAFFTRNPFQCAAYKGSEEVVKFLSSIGMLINEMGGSRYPLDIALSNNISIVIPLIRAGANPNVILHSKELLFFRIVRKGCIDIMKQLLEEKLVDPNLADEFGWTSLFFGVESGSIEMCKLLIDYGANIMALTSNGMDLLSYARKKSQPVLRYLKTLHPQN